MTRYYIPNDQDLPSEFKLLARRFRTDDQILGSAAGGGTGVRGGCEVNEHAPSPNMSVDVQSGLAVLNFVQFTVVGQTVAIPAANASMPRYDLITLDGAGTAHCRNGVANTSPVPVVVPDDEIALAMVLVPPAETAIENGQIVDKAVLVPTPLATNPWIVVSAGSDVTRTSMNTLTPDPVLKVPLLANTKYRIRGMVYFLARVASDLKVGWNGTVTPNTVVGQYDVTALGVPWQGQHINAYTATGVQVAIASGTTYTPAFHIELMVINGVSAGEFHITWSQNTSVAENTIRYAPSYLEYQQLV